jgi:hypothetical protein
MAIIWVWSWARANTADTVNNKVIGDGNAVLTISSGVFLSKTLMATLIFSAKAGCIRVYGSIIAVIVTFSCFAFASVPLPRCALGI